MGVGKWIGSAMGFMTMGPLGALAGYFIGSWFDKQAVGMQEDLQADEAGRGRYEQGRRNSFLFSMLVMASYVMRADRKIMHSEMEFVQSLPSCEFRGGRSRGGGTKSY